jgi:NhaP-type Na+/H+ or K+/H+ antiporter
MCLSATLIATDTIAPLTLINQKSYPTMFSLVFGEGVSNDAVSLIIMNVVLGLKTTKNGIFLINVASLGWGLVGDFFSDFFFITLKSVGFGIAMGILN